MPLAVDSLTDMSDTQSIRDAISQSIETCMKEPGRDPKQCAAIAYSIARKNTGQELAESTAR